MLLVGLGGMRWADVNQKGTPALWELAGVAGLGSTSVRTVTSATCPADGWLTVGAGQRASMQPFPTKAERDAGEPAVRGAGRGGDRPHRRAAQAGPYAIGVLVGTAIQLAIPTWDLRHTPFRLLRVFDWRSLEVRRVLLLMLPVTLSLGLINFNLLINSIFGSLVSEHAPAEIDKAFRIYMLPQGIFSVAVTTVLFPTLARLAARREYGDLRATMANGMRQIVLLLIPAAAAILVLSVPMVRLVYQRGEFDPGDTRRRRDRALLVRLLAAVQRPLPAAHPDLLQPPAALGADRDLGRQPGDHGTRRAGALLSRSGSAGSWPRR